jgi:hypothetical protein
LTQVRASSSLSLRLGSPSAFGPPFLLLIEVLYKRVIGTCYTFCLVRLLWGGARCCCVTL